MARIEERLAQPQRPEPEEDDDSWDDIDSGRKLRDASLKMTRSEIRKALESEGAVAKAALQKVADLELRDSIREVSGAYGGLSQEDLNRVMDYGISNGIDDLEICAYKVLGPPNAQTRRVVSDDEEPRQQAPHKPVLVGRGKSQAQAASAKPRQIKVRPGVRGYDDIEREAAQWLKGR